jgi:hypothetical protein
MSDDAEATRPLTNISVTFTVLREYASMGGTKVDGKKLADAITSLPIELETFEAKVLPGQYAKVDDLFVGKGYSEGLLNPCLLRVTGYAARKPGAFFTDTFGFFLQTAGPITPGEYFTADPPSGGDYKDKMPPGEAVGGVVLTDMPDGENDLQFISGRLIIKSLTDGYVEGNLAGIAAYKEYSEITGQDEIVETRNISAKFSIQASGAIGDYSDKPYACLKWSLKAK